MVTIKHKVTIKTKTAQEETPAAVEAPKVTIKPKQPETQKVTIKPKKPETPQTPPTPPTPDEPKGGSKAWIWIVVLVIAAIIAFFCFKNCGNKEDGKSDEGTGVPPTEQVVDSTENKETPEAATGEDAQKAEDEAVDNAGSDNAGEASNTDEPKAESNDDSKVASKQAPEKKNDTPSSVKEEKKQTSTSTGTVSTPTAQVSGDLEENARQVIRGVFGNGQERKDKLGSAYSEIQGRVNEMYRQGLVH